MAADPRGLARLEAQIKGLAAQHRTAASEALLSGGEALAGRIKSACADPVIAQTVKCDAGAVRGGEASQVKAEAGLVFHVHADGVLGEKGHVHNPTWEEFGTAAHSLHKGADRESGKYQDLGPHHPGAHRRPFFWPTVRAWRRSMRTKMMAAARKAAKAAAAQ